MPSLTFTFDSPAAMDAFKRLAAVVPGVTVVDSDKKETEEPEPRFRSENDMDEALGIAWPDRK